MNKKRILSSVLAACLAFGTLATTAFAADVANATIDTSKKASLTIYKYDLTNAEKDGVWDSSYVSTGVYDASVNSTLGNTIRGGDTDTSSDLGNGETSNGYAIKGVEFTYLKIADVVQFSESTEAGSTSSIVKTLYGINKTTGVDFLTAIGLKQSDAYALGTNYTELNDLCIYFESNVLNDALAESLESNATTVKNALEDYVADQGGTAMALTDADGYTQATNLDLGLYLIVETKVPEYVVDTTNPFLVALPMTTVNGSNATNGGEEWNYDVTLYPKNLTGIPSLEKTLREDVNDTGLNDGSATDITDGYEHTGTGSSGDVIDYQIISTLPSITSAATYLTDYTFVDTLSSGLTYNKDVKIEFFTDKDCTNRVATWNSGDGKFTVNYKDNSDGSHTMTIAMTSAGLSEINTSKAVYTSSDAVNSGYSDCTLRITYTATLDSDNTVVFGDVGNPNKVVLTWSRSSTNYFDTLVDDAHVYTYGIDLTKTFSEGAGDFSNVEFILHNDTDNYYVVATLNASEGVYYVTDHVTAESDATHFVPVTSGSLVNASSTNGKIVIKGLEDDTYTLTEVKTDNGYTLLKDDIEITISVQETEEYCDIYDSDVLGLVQNDPRYTTELLTAVAKKNNMTLEQFIASMTNAYDSFYYDESGNVVLKEDLGSLANYMFNIPQTQLAHHLLTASAVIDGNTVTMLSETVTVDGTQVTSANAEAPLTVVNTPGFQLPKTGGAGLYVVTILGVMAVAAGAFVVTRKKHSAE